MISVTHLNVSTENDSTSGRNVRIVINDGRGAGTHSDDLLFIDIEIESIVTIYVGDIVVATMYLRNEHIANFTNEIGIEMFIDGVIRRTDRSFTV